jgi:hypothetical protein
VSDLLNPPLFCAVVQQKRLDALLHHRRLADGRTSVFTVGGGARQREAAFPNVTSYCSFATTFCGRQNKLKDHAGVQTADRILADLDQVVGHHGPEQSPLSPAIKPILRKQ